MKAKAKIAEPLGANTLVHGEVPDLKIPIVLSLAGVHQIELDNDILGFSVDAAHIHLFGSITGRRLTE